MTIWSKDAIFSTPLPSCSPMNPMEMITPKPPCSSLQISVESHVAALYNEPPSYLDSLNLCLMKVHCRASLCVNELLTAEAPLMMTWHDEGYLSTRPAMEGVKPPPGFMSKEKHTYIYIHIYIKLNWHQSYEQQSEEFLIGKKELDSEDTLQDNGRLLNNFSWRYRTPVWDAK